MYKEPTLARTYRPGKDDPFPCLIEPKLDGMRVLAFVVNDKVIGGTSSPASWTIAEPGVYFYSRTGKELAFDTFDEELLRLSAGRNYVFDGELMGESFEDTMRRGRRKSNRDESTLKFWIFDAIRLSEWVSNNPTRTFFERKANLNALFSNQNHYPDLKKLMPISGSWCPDEENLMHSMAFYLKEGYEGAMLKQDVPYEHKRSSNLLKAKEFETHDCEIVGYIEGKGKHAGRLGKFLVKLGDAVFGCGTGFSDEQRENYWKDRQNLLGNIVEVKAQEVTRVGALRFPAFVRMRPDKED